LSQQSGGIPTRNDENPISSNLLKEIVQVSVITEIISHVKFDGVEVSYLRESLIHLLRNRGR
jgi:hypothetical protein